MSCLRMSRSPYLALLVLLATATRSVCDAAPPGDPAGAHGEGIRFNSSDERLVAIFQWAQGTAAGYVGEDNDPVGPWYEAALPGREAFCIRDVSHQCIGAEILGYAKQNSNMFLRIAEGISEGRDFCSFWEIDKNGGPAPVDYASDDDFWYPLSANFDFIDACYRLYEWTGDPTYVDDAAFDRFFRLTLGEYVERWQLQPDRVMERAPFMNLKPSTVTYRLARGIPTYDEQQSDIVVGSDLLGMIGSAFETYARILSRRGQGTQADEYARRAEQYRELLESRWWDESSRCYFAFYTADGKFHTGGVAGNEFLLWHRAARDPQRIVSALRGIQNTQVEVLSYLPMLNYRYGFDNEAYDGLTKLHSDPRRAYPEASFAAIESIVRGLMGVQPCAEEGLVATCPHLTASTAWAEVENVPVLGGRISLKHSSPTESAFTNGLARTITWRATFQGSYDEITVDGKARPAQHTFDAVGHPRSYVDVVVEPEARAVARAHPSTLGR